MRIFLFFYKNILKLQDNCVNILGFSLFLTNLHPQNRWLHPDDPLRRGYGPGGPPAARTHSKACAQAHASEATAYTTWEKSNHVRLTTGINHWCPFSVLLKFDMIWDFCPDMMHIVKTFFERLVLGVFSGTRRPNYTDNEPTKPKRQATHEERKDYQEKLRNYKTRQVEYDKELSAFDACIFDAEAQKTVDQRVQNLVGYSYWIRSSLVS